MLLLDFFLAICKLAGELFHVKQLDPICAGIHYESNCPA